MAKPKPKAKARKPAGDRAMTDQREKQVLTVDGACVAVHHGRVRPDELKAHPHMLRHACGYALVNKGHDTRAIQGWLGHRSITSTAVYTALASNRFKDFWRE
jgi:site-specific recombinase XerD